MYIRNKNRSIQITNIHVMKIHLKYEVKILKDELTGNPRWGQNVIDKVWVCGNLKQLNETFDKYKI